MKVLMLSLVGALMVATAQANRSFSLPSVNHEEAGKPDRPPRGAAFGNQGAQMDLCGSTDCQSGQRVRIAMSRLEEIGPDNKTIANHKAETFASLDATWSDLQTIVIDGVNVTSTSFVTDLDVGPKGKKVGTATFNLTASMFQGNATVYNGNQSISVPAGALKFTVMISNWPFAADANFLTFGVSLKSRLKGGNDGPKPDKKVKPNGNGAAHGNSSHIERVDLGEGMLMDAPTQAVVDGVNVEISSSIDMQGMNPEFAWRFPSFKSNLSYDPTTALSTNAQTAGSDAGTVAVTTMPTTTATPTNKTNSSNGSKSGVGSSFQMPSTAIALICTLVAVMLA